MAKHKQLAPRQKSDFLSKNSGSEIRPDSGTAVLDEEGKKVVVDYLKVVALGQMHFRNIWHSLLGLMTPDILKASKRGKYTSGTSVAKKEDAKTKKPVNKKSKDKNKKKSTVVLNKNYSDEIHCFTCWFVLQKSTAITKDFELPANQLRSTFTEYWTSLTGTNPTEDPMFNVMIDSIENEESRSAESVWVDYRKMALETLPSVIFTIENTRRVLCDSDFPICENGAQGATRVLFSKFLGKGQKSDFKKENDLNDDFLSCLKWALENDKSPEEAFARFCDIRQISSRISESINSDQLVSYLRDGKKGRACSKVNIVKNLWKSKSWYKTEDKTIDEKKNTDALKSHINAVSDLLKKSTERDAEGSLEENPIWNWIKSNIEAKAMVPYDFEHFSHWSDRSIEGLRSYTKSFYNKIDTKWDNNSNLQLLEKKPITFEWLKEPLSQLKRTTGQVYFNVGQLNGHEDVISHLLAIYKRGNWSGSAVDAVKAAQEASPFRFGDSAFLICVAEAMQKNMNYDVDSKKLKDLEEDIKITDKLLIKKVFDDVYSLVKIDQAKSAIYTERWPYIKPLTETFYMPPSFGVSKPYCKLKPLSAEESIPFINNGRPEGYGPHSNVVVNLIKSEGTFDFVIPFHGKKFVMENMITVPDAPVDLKNDPSFRRKHGGVHVQPSRPTVEVLEKYSVSFKYESETDKIKMSFIKSHEVYKPIWKELLKKVGDKIVSVDVGQRDAGTYIIFERTPIDEGDLNISDVENPTGIKIVRGGYLEQSLTASDTNKRECVLLGSEADEIPIQILRIWRRNDRAETPVISLPRILLDLAYDLKKMAAGIRDNENRSVNFQKIIELADASLGCVGSMDFSARGQGGLSFLRMEKFEVLRQSLNSIIGTLKKRGLLPPEKLVEKLRGIQKKYEKIRLERVKRTSDSLDVVCGSVNASILVRENIELNSKHKSSRKMNRRAAQWCIGQVMKKIDGDCNLHERFCKAIGAQYTSVINWFEDEIQTRYALVTQQQFSGKMAESAQKDFARLNKKDPEDLSKTEASRLKEWKSFLRKRNLTEDTNLTTIDLGIGSHYIPNSGGKWFKNAKLAALLGMPDEFVDADMNAAFNIGLRGLRLLLSPL